MLSVAVPKSIADSVVVHFYYEVDVRTRALKKFETDKEYLKARVKDFMWVISDELNDMAASGATYVEEYFHVVSMEGGDLQDVSNRLRVSSLRRTLGQNSAISSRLNTSKADYAIIVELHSSLGSIWELSWVFLDLSQNKIKYAGGKEREVIQTSEQLEHFLERGPEFISSDFANTFDDYFKVRKSKKIILASCFLHSLTRREGGDDRSERLDALQHQIPVHLAATLNETLESFPSLKEYSALPLPFTTECSNPIQELYKTLFERHKASFLIHGHMDMAETKNQLTFTLHLVPFDMQSVPMPWSHKGPNYNAEVVADAMADVIAHTLDSHLQKVTTR